MVNSILTIIENFFRAIYNFANWYSSNADFKTPLIALAVCLLIYVVVVAYGMDNEKNDVFSLSENGIITGLFLLILIMGISINIAAIGNSKLPKYIFDIPIFIMLLTIMISIDMFLSVIKNITIDGQDLSKNIIFIVTINSIYISLGYSLIIPGVISIVFIILMKLSSRINKLIKLMIIKKYGLLYNEDEYVELMKNVKIEE